MNDETKEEIKAVLTLLKHTLVKNGVSMGNSGKKLLFFSTNHYVATGKFDGFSVEMDSLVK
jgi:hypothetical protein